MCLLLPSLISTRQHPSYGDCLEVKREYYQNCSVLGCVWHHVHSQQHTHMSSSYRSSRLGLSHWDPYAIHRGGCLELYYCNMVQWSWWDSSLIWKTNWFPSVLWLDTVGLVAWPVKIVREMTYNVSSGTLSLHYYVTAAINNLFSNSVLDAFIELCTN